MDRIKGFLHETDFNTLLIFNNLIKCRLFDKIMPLLTHMGSGAVTIMCCLMLIWRGNTDIRKMGLEALLALAFSHLLVQLLKRCICRRRPLEMFANINTFKVAIDLYSFPSGHTTAAFALATIFTLHIPLLAFACYPIAVIVAITRLYLGVHYPSDVLAGMILGTISSCFVFLGMS